MYSCNIFIGGSQQLMSIVIMIHDNYVVFKNFDSKDTKLIEKLKA